MKRVLVLGGDSFVGVHVCQKFYSTGEFAVEISSGCSGTSTAEAGELASHRGGLRLNKEGSCASPPSAASQQWSCTDGSPAVSRGGEQPHGRVAPPASLQPSVCAVIPAYSARPDDFCQCVLENDVVVAVLDDSPQGVLEATSAMRVLMNSHYDVEKTMVLVSSVLTWADTLPTERAAAAAAKRQAREAARAAYWEERLAEVEGDEEETADLRAIMDDAASALAELPPELREPVEEETDEELVPMRTFTADAYATRLPHPLVAPWKELEQLTKRANSATLHTYVLFAGLPYGAGEGPLAALFTSAYAYAQSANGQPAAQGDKERERERSGAGDAVSRADDLFVRFCQLVAREETLAGNALPMVHVKDLAKMVYRVGAAYDVLDQRYFFAVDQGQTTTRQLVQAIESRFGVPGSAAAAAAAGAAASPPATLTEAGMVNFYDATLARPRTNAELRASLSSSSSSTTGAAVDVSVLAAFSPTVRAVLLSDVRAEPSAALLSSEAEETPDTAEVDDWAALSGIVMNVDRVVREFATAHEWGARRFLLMGPPLTGVETMAATLSQTYRVPLLTAEGVTRRFEQHVAELRAELVGRLSQRLRRRWAREHHRRVRELAAARTEADALAASDQPNKNGRTAQAREGETNNDEEDEEEGQGEEEDEDEEEGEAGSGRRRAGEERADAASSASALSASFSFDRLHTPRHLAARLTERYVRGVGADTAQLPEDDDDAMEADAGDADDGAAEEAAAELEEREVQADEEAFALEEENAAAAEAVDEEEGRVGASRAHLRALAAIRAAELAESVQIRVLQEEYGLALKALSLRLEDGHFPHRRRAAKGDADDGHDVDGIDDGSGGEGSTEDGAAPAKRVGPADMPEQADEEDGEEVGEGEEEEEDDDEEGAQKVEHGLGAGEASESGGRAQSTGAAGKRSRTVRTAATSAPVVQYMEEATAFFMRWRLRQPDCRTHGYVMLNYPSSVQEACLVFSAGAASAAGEMAEGDGRAAVSDLAVLPPSTLEEIVPPADASFPLPELRTMPREQLERLEADVRVGAPRPLLQLLRDGASVLDAPMESIFPDHAILLEDKDEALQALAASLASQHSLASGPGDQKGTSPAAGVSTSSLPVDVAVSPQESHLGSHTVVRKVLSPSTYTAPALPALSAATANTTAAAAAAAGAAEHAATASVQAALQRYLLTGDTFYHALSSFRAHHRIATGSIAPPPTESLTTWLQCVQTGEAVGAVPPPLVVHRAVGGGAAAAAAAHTGASLSPPASTARMAVFDVLPAPPRDAATLRRELAEAWAALTPEGPADGDPLHTGAVPSVAAHQTPQSDPLRWMADKLSRTVLPPPAPSPGQSRAAPPGHTTGLTSADSSLAPYPLGTRPLAGSPVSTLISRQGSRPSTRERLAVAPAANAGAAAVGVEEDEAQDARERAVLGELQQSELSLHAQLNRMEEAGLRAEHMALRYAQLKEQCLGAWPAAQLSKEEYLLTYVLPRLTPAIAEVVRIRPSDPVTALADLLYNYQDPHSARV